MSVSGRASLGLAFGLVASCALMLLGASSAGAFVIKVNAPSKVGGQVQLDTSELGQKDVNGVEYLLPGGERRSVTGWSLEKVLITAAGRPGASGWLDASNLPSVTLVPPSSNPNADISVSSQEITDRGIFGGALTPVLTENSNGSVDFIKPGRNGTLGTTFRYTGSVEIDVQGSRPPVKRLGLKINPKQVKKGGSVSFTVTVPGRSAAGLDFVWRFREVESGWDAQASSSGGSFTRAFSREGLYGVTVKLKRNDLGIEGGSGSFTVGRKQKEKNPPQPSGRNSPPPAGSPATGDFGGSGGFGGFGGGLPGSGGQSGGSDLGFPEPVPEEPLQEAAPQPELPVVSGELLGPDVEVTELPPGTESESVDQQADESGGFGLPGEAWTLFGVGVLMGLGGFIELRVLSRVG